ncbi:phosphatidylserine decarboxylase [Tilletia horrida]|nr:phosphatidylserine decarboxylase [Tilletia horrida]
MAIRSAIDVYGENVREVVEFHSPQFGTFYVVCIGAMMVGSIGLELRTGQEVKRGDPFGWFAFGGSTLCMVLPPGACAFDEDLLENSGRALETLVRVGMRLGKATGAVTGTGNAAKGEGGEGSAAAP